MGTVKVEVDPGEVGLDAGRLARADARLDRYVDEGRLPGFLLVVARGGRVAHVTAHGRRDVAAGLPVEPDTVFRIFSMTKPITSVLTMMLSEEGAFQLTDPISRWLPAFEHVRVYQAGSDLAPVTVPATEPIRIRHLLTHTSGLTYGFHHAHPVDSMLRAHGYEWGSPAGTDLATAVDTWAGLPLLFQPGAEWNYSLATDVLGRLIEVVTGQSLDVAFAERVLGPLGLTETAFWAPEESLDRLAALYVAVPGGMVPAPPDLAAVGRQRPSMFSGGGGLVSTAGDYQRFLEFLRRGGELDGVRLLGPHTLAYMTRNHLPGNADLVGYGRPLFAESPLHGVGFGLGFATVIDPSGYGTPVSAGDYNWGGAASTAFWVDPSQDLTVSFFTQLVPSSALPLRTLLRTMVNAAVVGPGSA